MATNEVNEIWNDLLLAMNQNFVPVIDDRKTFIGIVTRSDILQYCHTIIKENKERENRQ